MVHRIRPNKCTSCRVKYTIYVHMYIAHGNVIHYKQLMSKCYTVYDNVHIYQFPRQVYYIRTYVPNARFLPLKKKKRKFNWLNPKRVSIPRFQFPSQVCYIYQFPSQIYYGVALVSRIDKIISLYCKRAM